ncbi:MAG: dehydrogenase [Alphaproteobacteria bacterium]
MELGLVTGGRAAAEPQPGGPVAVRARAPLRLGLAGGGTDVSPYADLHGGAVVNATIGRWIHAEIERIAGDEVIVESRDLGVAQRHPVGALPIDGRLDLPKAVYNRVVRDFLGGHAPALRIATLADAPPGSGLGASSTLAVAVLQAFRELFGLPLDAWKVARLAYAVERGDLGLAGGRQDQYASAFGGFNFMEFGKAGDVRVTPVPVAPATLAALEAQIVLCFTGVSRESAAIIAEQAANVRAGVARSLAATHRLKASAFAMRDALAAGDLARVAATLRDGWTSKRDMAHAISNARIEEVLAAATAAGAHAGKVSGAGGGGYMMFLATADRRAAVVTALERLGCRTDGCAFTGEGASAWPIR